MGYLCELLNLGFEDFDKNLRRLKRFDKDHVNKVIDRYEAERKSKEQLKSIKSRPVC